MARNVEIKARIGSIGEIEPSVAAIADSGPIAIIQDDTFFACQSGRFKLRAYSRDAGELIFYRRANEAGPKESFYLCSSTSEPDCLRELLSQAYGIAGRVRKRRILYTAGRTRIHLDNVEGLGEFLELEVVLKEGELAAQGIKEADELIRRLGIERLHLVDSAYVDLLNPAGDG
jgi:adenylate cyclase class IV